MGGLQPVRNSSAVIKISLIMVSVGKVYTAF
jgi:hypothetical protein